MRPQLREMDADTVYLFRHALMRDAVYQLMLPGVRSRLHRLVLEVCEKLPRAALSPRELAAHARSGQEGADADTTVYLREREGYWLQAAIDAAAGRSDLVTWLPMQERLVELSRGGDDEFRHLIKLAEVQRETGSVARAEQTLQHALALAGCNHERVFLARQQLAGVLIRTGRLKEAAALVRQQLESARRGGDDESVGDALGMLGVACYHLGDFSRAESSYRQARRVAARHGAVSRMARYTANLALLLGESGRFLEAERAHREAVRLAEKAHDRMALANALGNFALLLTDSDRQDEAVQAYHRALELEHQVGHRPGYAIALANLGRLMRMMDRYTEAEQMLKEAVALHREFASARHEGSTLGQLADVYTSQGRFDEALDQFTRGIAVLHEARDRLWEGVLLTGRGRLRLNLADTAGAREDLEAARKLLGPGTPEAYRRACLYPLEAYVAAAGLDEGADLAEVAKRVGELERRYSGQSEIGERKNVEAVAGELRAALDEGRPVGLHCGVPLSGIVVKDSEQLLAWLRRTNPEAAANLVRLLAG